jgi:hypothetical protein
MPVGYTEKITLMRVDTRVHPAGGVLNLSVQNQGT